MKESLNSRFPVGTENFREIRQNGGYYIDKTEMIETLLADSFKVQLVTRPRRFGKTLTMSMLEDFFDIERDSKADFDGLAVSKNTELCAEWQNQWPTVFLTLKSVNGDTFESAYEMFQVLVADLCKKYAFLAESNKVDQDDLVLFQKLKAEQADETTLKNCLYLLTRMMYTHYGKPVILLVDEYDVPLAKANEKGYYRQMLDVIRAMFDKSMKTNDFLKFAVITGCLRISKESIFTGMNNFVSDTISGGRLEKYVGFTEAEVLQLLKDADLLNHAPVFKKWYDGYRFGKTEMYCPWDVLNYARDLQNDPDAEPETYWANTSGNYILRSFLRNATRTTKKEIEDLIAGGSVVRQINEQLTYDELEKNIANLWSVLYMTGYLTIKEKRENRQLELVIPNREICEIYKTQVQNWFEEDVVEQDQTSYDAFCQAFVTGNAEEAEKLFQKFLLKSISIRDTFVPKPKKENFYHGILMGMFMSRSGWYAHSNSEAGEGYSDVHVEADDLDTAFVIEVKYAENGEMDAACQEALDQIDRMHYVEGLEELDFGTIYAYGIACFKKRCRVVCRLVKKENEG